LLNQDPVIIFPPLILELNIIKENVIIVNINNKIIIDLRILFKGAIHNLFFINLIGLYFIIKIRDVTNLQI
jgi:hypothetical protein